MLNRWTGIGRVGHTPKLTSTQGGIAKLTFSMATDLPRKNADGSWSKRTDWHNVIVWGTRAVSAEKRITKGSLVYVEGPTLHREYQPKDGPKKRITEVEANKVEVIKDSKTKGQAPPDRPEPPPSAYESDDEISY
jgi:single-strand DNA-binding protein